MGAFCWILGGVAIGIGALRTWSLKYVSNRRGDEIHYVRTADGWSIALHRVKPRKKVKGLSPVILCHGLGANHFNLDLNERYSVAAMLAENGYDCFLIDLRSIGDSARQRLFANGKWDVCFDDFVFKDIPAAIDYVLDLCNAKKVHWVGHSMGGMVAYAFSQFDTVKKVRSVLAIASPGDWKPLRPTFAPVLFLSPVLRLFPVIHNSLFTKFSAPLVPYDKKSPLTRAIYIRENMDPEVLRSAAVNLVDNLPTKLLMQFAGWMKLNGFFSNEGYNYKTNMGKITVPFCFFTGESDFFAPYEGVRNVFEAISSKDKRHIHFSKRNGTQDYGHGDIVLGKSAPMEVFPQVLKWIEEHK